MCATWEKLGAVVLAAGVVSTAVAEERVPPELRSPNKRRVETQGLPDDGNHDPSNVVRHDGRFYCWYTEHFTDDYAPFVGTRIRLMTSPKGKKWTDRGVALGPGEETPWDAKGALTAYVVPHNGRFYMFYSAVPAGFEGPRQGENHVAIALAVAEKPTGPWRRHEAGPVFEASDSGWDRAHVDDANLIRRHGRWWLYYKGFTKEDSPAETRLGLATAVKLTGPYHRHPENPLIDGHAFSAWKHRGGVALVGGAHTKQIAFWSPDGLSFVPAGPFPNRSTGFYCPPNFRVGPNNQGVTWGIDTAAGGGEPRRLIRFRCDLRVRN